MYTSFLIHINNSMALTDNKNFLSPVGFAFKIDTTEFPNLEYFCTAVTLPGITSGDTPLPYRGVNIAMSGDRMYIRRSFY